MKCATILAAMLAAITTPAHAALPPEHQRVAELRAVIDEATKVLGVIDSIKFLSNDLYEARSAACVVAIRIKDLPGEQSSGPVDGPRRFKAAAAQPTCA